jgi:4-amino-4-deoxy-L-arabinose transferase-like glycosyltransferase
MDGSLAGDLLEMTTISATDPAPGEPAGGSDQTGAPTSDEQPRVEVQAARSRRLGIGLIVICAGIGLVIRILAVTSWYPNCPPRMVFGERVSENCLRNTNWGDAFYFTTQGKLLAEGHGFVSPTYWLMHRTTNPAIPEYLPGAGHPPLYTIMLAGLYKAGMDTPGDQRIVFPFVGTVGVVLIAAAAWLVAGRRGPVVGPIAAFIAATYPMLWINDFRYLSESIYIPILALLVISLYRFAQSPSFGSGVFAGAMFGLASLTRGEGVSILVFTLPFILWGMKDRPWKKRLMLGGTIVGVMALVMAPWIIYNLNRFDKPVLVTSGTGMVLLYGSCDQTFYGDALGYYSFKCGDALKPHNERLAPLGEAHADVTARELALDYVREHAGRFPVVALARIGRMWDLYAPFQNVELNDHVEGRGYYPSLIGLWYFWLLLPPAIYGAIVLRRRGTPLSPLLGLAVAVTLTAALTFGVTRYRVPAEVSLVILAAVGLDAAISRWRARAGLSASSELADATEPTDAARSSPAGPAATEVGVTRTVTGPGL